MSEYSIKWYDSPKRYGVVSRFLHWLMFIVFTLLFLELGLELGLDIHAQRYKFIPSHGDFGAALLVMVTGRTLWACANHSIRHHHSQKGFTPKKLSQFCFYVLMLATPLLGLLFFYSHGKRVRLLGVFVFQNVAPSANLQTLLTITEPLLAQTLHGAFGWALLSLIVLHIAVVLVHQFHLRDGMFRKMWKT